MCTNPTSIALPAFPFTPVATPAGLQNATQSSPDFLRSPLADSGSMSDEMTVWSGCCGWVVAEWAAAGAGWLREGGGGGLDANG